MDHFLDDENCIKRLVHEWETYGQLIIAYDYDNTVFDYNKRDIHFVDVPMLLRELKRMGCHLVVFTSCEDSRFPEIKEYLDKNNIPFDSINETPDFIPFHGRKVYYNALLDDRAGLSAAYRQLTEVCVLMRISKRNKLMETRQDIDF